MTAPKTALITGASRGLGRALARDLAAAGWQLLLDARTASALEAVRSELAALTTVIAVAGDIGDTAHCQALAQAAAQRGGLAAVINNAGILGPSPQPALLDYPLDGFSNVLHINLVAQLGVLQALRPHLHDDAVIINITSDAAREAYAGWGGYGASKAGLEQLSNILAAENPQWRVYTVDPGDIRTQMHQDAFPGEDISDRPLPETCAPAIASLLDSGLASGRYVASDLAVLH